MDDASTPFRSSSIPRTPDRGSDGTNGNVGRFPTTAVQTTSFNSSNINSPPTDEAGAGYDKGRSSLVIQTTSFDNSSPTSPSVERAGSRKVVNRPPISIGTSGSQQHVKDISRHKQSPSLHHRTAVTEEEGCYPALNSPLSQHLANRLGIQRIRSASTSDIVAPGQSDRTTRPHAMHELLSSERTYARDLALVCNIHIPLAQGEPVCTDDRPRPLPPSANPFSRSGPSPLRFTVSSHSSSRSQHGPPMSNDDVDVVFRNIRDISRLSSEFVECLETTVNHAPGGSGDEDGVGELFLEIIPTLESLYKTYLRNDSKAITHFSQLSSSRAIWDYRSRIRDLLPDEVGFRDLPFFLLKPKKRLSEYCHLLRSIVDATPFSHRGRAALVQALGLMERIERDINGNSNRSGMALCGVPAIKIASVANRTNGHGHAEVTKLAHLGNRLQTYVGFLDRLTETVKGLQTMARHSVESLQQWAITFGSVLGIAALSNPAYPAYTAFTSLVCSLLELHQSLDDDLQKSFHGHLHELKVMIERPKRLLDEVRSPQLAHTPSSPFPRFKFSNISKNRQHNDQSRLLSELPVLLAFADKAIRLAIQIMAQRLIAFLRIIKETWISLFDSLQEEGEQYGGAEETLRAWEMRWDVGQQMLLKWSEEYKLGDSGLGERATSEIGSAPWSVINFPTVQLATPVGLSPVRDMSPLSLGSPRKLRTSISYPPGPPSSRRTRQSVMAVVPDSSIIQVRRPYSPPPHAPYRGHTFFNLTVDDSFEVLQEYGHPLTYPDLPRFCLGKKDEEDCLLKVRARGNGIAGDVGWALARFVYPVD